ncbi:MAG: DNA-binding response regulator, partial [Paeniglutamicibacter terrestris]
MTDETVEQRTHAPGVREQTIRVLLVDDHEAIRLGMRMVVESAAGFEVAGEANNGVNAVTMA